MNAPELSQHIGNAVLSCEAVDREAIRYYFNGLPKGRKEAVRAHLAQCPRCRRKLEAFEQGWRLDGQRRGSWAEPRAGPGGFR